MWTSQIKSSTLLVVMMAVALVLSATEPMPDRCRIQLKKIRKEVKKFLNEKWGPIYVPKTTKITNTYPENFLCLAEKILKNITVESVNIALSTLTKDLEVYNKGCSTSCTLNTTMSYHLHQFLNDVDRCVTYKLNEQNAQTKTSRNI